MNNMKSMQGLDICITSFILCVVGIHFVTKHKYSINLEYLIDAYQNEVLLYSSIALAGVENTASTADFMHADTFHKHYSVLPTLVGSGYHRPSLILPVYIQI